MSLNSEQFQEMDYSFISSVKNEKDDEIIINNGDKDINKKQNLTKSLSSSGLNIIKFNKPNTFPKIVMNKKKHISLGKKLNLTSNSFKSIKNAYRTYNFQTNLINKINKPKNIKNLIQSKNEIEENLPNINDNAIKTLPNNININEKQPNLINIFGTKDEANKKEESFKGIFNDSQRIKNEYNNIQREFVKKKNSIKSLKEEEKISKNEEIEMKNKVLVEQINKLNYLYFNALQKLIQYEESIKNIHKLKESKLKNEYFLLELEYKYNNVLEELNKSNKKLEELQYLVNKKNSKLKQCQKNLDYYFQLNQKLLIDADNIFMSPKFLSLKQDYETKINENKKKLEFYKEENFKKDKIILELNVGNKNINELYNSISSTNFNQRNCYFQNAQKISKEYFTKNKEKKQNSEIISLKNKINILQEKIDKMNKIIKEYERNEKCFKRFNSNQHSKTAKKISLDNNDNNNNLNRNIFIFNEEKLKIQKISEVNYLQIENKEQIDVDFMSNLNINEFLYVLKKCFEAQYIHIEDIKAKALNQETFDILKENKVSNYNNFIQIMSKNLFKLIKIRKNKDKSDILSLVKTFLFNNYIEIGNNIEELKKQFENAFKDMIIYDKNMEDKYIKQLAKYFKDKINSLKKEFEFIDFNKKGNITFIALKKVIEKLKINLKNDILEYMIFFMKRSCINDIINVNYSLRDLNYKIFLDKISSQIKSHNELDIDSNSNLSEIEDNNLEGTFNANLTEDNSLIEITNEEYNEKLSLIMNAISSEIMKKCNKSTEEYINKLFDKYIITNEVGNQLIELTKLVEEIKNSLFIELNQIDIFCLYSKFQINENNNKNINNSEMIDFKLFKKEILFYAEQIKKLKNNDEVIQIDNTNENFEKNIMKDINKIDEIDQKKISNEIEEIKEIKNQNEEYNDFENNNFDKEE